MKVKTYVAKAVRGADHGVQAAARFKKPVRRFLGFVVIVAALLILMVFIPISGGLGLAALLFKESACFYGSLAVLGIMGGLLALVFKFKLNTDKALNAITDLTGLTEFILDELLESLLEGVTLLGLGILILGGGVAAGAHFLERDWLWPVAVAILGTGGIWLVLGTLVALGIRRPVGERLKEKAKEAIHWAQELGGESLDGAENAKEISLT